MTKQDRLRLTLAFFLPLFAVVSLQSQTPPKREFRAAWVATVTNLDWPGSNSQTSAIQQADLVNLIRSLHDLGMNAIIFQVRTECDALYASPYEPWSYWLTGQQGTAPFPYFDPLEVATAEAHRLGMEIHAWFNPYRAERVIGSYTLAANHPTVVHPDWAITIGTFRFLDPGKQVVREHNLRVIADVIRRYDIDGVHFDDYFYPYPPNEMTAGKPANDVLDNATFSAEPRGFVSKYEWRRDNVNLFFRQLQDSIQAIKPFVRLGVSPFGIWRNGVPTGITGLDAYSTIYCDGMTWLNDGSVDYMTPQLYWQIGGGQDYSKLMPWWADSARADGRHLYPGHAPYRIVSSNWSSSELPNQIRLDRQPNRAQGGVFFRAGNGLLDNPKGFADSLRTDLYRTRALVPVMDWKNLVPPNEPTNLQFTRLASQGPAILAWDAPSPAADGETARRYVIYRFTSPTILPGQLDDPSYILGSTDQTHYQPETPPAGPEYYYAVSSLDQNHNESGASPTLLVAVPPAPLLAAPTDASGGHPTQVTVRWYSGDVASTYRLQVGTDSTFAGGVILDVSNYADTSASVSVSMPQQTYYWRVNASNAGGTGEFSAVWSFTTGFPASPLLASPPHATLNVPIPVEFSWFATPGALTYDFQLATNSLFSPSIIDTAGLSDTTITVGGLQEVRNHFWRVRSVNGVGASPWSTISAFRTGVVVSVEQHAEIPTVFRLDQNYPNPFNPTTTIRFSLPRDGMVTLRVYDLLGREVASLIQEDLVAGTYSVAFDATGFASGTYVYVLTSAGERLTGKMLFLK
jgi:uncharacterized lipoprotein YddW (UPF0748 family)